MQVNARYFDNENGKSWASSSKDNNRQILLVSQFTLLGEHKKGNKPDFHKAMGGEQENRYYVLSFGFSAEETMAKVFLSHTPLRLLNLSCCLFATQLFDEFTSLVQKELGRADDVKVGAFGEHMQVALVNDGPVTMIMERITEASVEESGQNTPSTPTETKKARDE